MSVSLLYFKILKIDIWIKSYDGFNGKKWSFLYQIFQKEWLLFHCRCIFGRTFFKIFPASHSSWNFFLPSSSPYPLNKLAGIGGTTLQCIFQQSIIIIIIVDHIFSCHCFRMYIPNGTCHTILTVNIPYLVFSLQSLLENWCPLQQILPVPSFSVHQILFC